MRELSSLLAEASARHSHFCPRQVLGVRMALAAASVLGLTLPARDKELLVIAEMYGCFVDGLQVAAGVSAGRRTLRIEDYGKVAATFVNVRTGEAVRLAPRAGVRQWAWRYAGNESTPYAAQLAGYQLMPDEELFTSVPVSLDPSLDAILSRPHVRTVCATCGEEIINEREVLVDGVPYCRSCAGGSYYRIGVPATDLWALVDEMA